MPDDVEGSVVGENETRPPDAQLARVESGVLTPLDVGEVRRSMQTYQQGLQSLLDQTDWQQTNDKPFVKKSGWRKIATWFSLSVEVRSQRVERDPNGVPERATVICRAIAPNGRYMDGDGHASTDESRFKKSSGRQKLENDLTATASTRAKNRAIADLVGMGEVSAEEVEYAPMVPEAGVAASDELAATTRKALDWLFGEYPDGNERVSALVTELGNTAGVGYTPRSAAQAVVLLAKELRSAATESGVAEDPQEADVPTDEPKEGTDVTESTDEPSEGADDADGEA
jgi:hypothetical protein